MAPWDTDYRAQVGPISGGRQRFPAAFPGGRQPTDASWLDGNHSHVAGQTWCTFARTSDMLNPGPAKTFMLLDEDYRSINDGMFVVVGPYPGHQHYKLIDWPAESCAPRPVPIRAATLRSDALAPEGGTTHQALASITPFAPHGARYASSAGRLGLADRTEPEWLTAAATLHPPGRELQTVREVFDDRTQLALASDLGMSRHSVNTNLERLRRKRHVLLRAKTLRQLRRQPQKAPTLRVRPANRLRPAPPARHTISPARRQYSQRPRQAASLAT